MVARVSRIAAAILLATVGVLGPLAGAANATIFANFDCGTVPYASGDVCTYADYDVSQSCASVKVQNPVQVINHTNRYLHLQVKFYDSNQSWVITQSSVNAGATRYVNIDNPWGPKPAAVQTRAWTAGHENAPGWNVVPLTACG